MHFTLFLTYLLTLKPALYALTRQKGLPILFSLLARWSEKLLGALDRQQTRFEKHQILVFVAFILSLFSLLLVIGTILWYAPKRGTKRRPKRKSHLRQGSEK